MPSYIDKICSEDTNELVEEHINNCNECKLILESLKEPTISLILSEDERLKAQRPFNIIKKKNLINIAVAIAITFIITIISIFIIQNVGAIHDVFFPQEYISINPNTNLGEWGIVQFEENEYLYYNSIYYKKTVTNHANSGGSIMLRILDEYENIVMDKFLIDPGQSASLKYLKNNVKYIVEVFLEDSGSYFIIFN